MRLPGNPVHQVLVVLTIGAGLLFVPKPSFGQG